MNSLPLLRIFAECSYYFAAENTYDIFELAMSGFGGHWRKIIPVAPVTIAEDIIHYHNS